MNPIALSCGVAFKEWATTCLALGEGRPERRKDNASACYV